MLCRTCLPLVRFCSGGAAFKPVAFKHKITETDFNVTGNRRSETKAEGGGLRRHRGRDQQVDELSGQVPVIKTPFPRSQNVSDRLSAPKKTRKYSFDFNSKVEKSGKNYLGSQTVTDHETQDGERFPRYIDDSQADVKNENFDVEFPRRSEEANGASRQDRGHTKSLDAPWSSSRNVSSKKKTHWKHKMDEGRIQARINDEAFEMAESLLRDYDSKEHVYGIHPVLLALKAGKREIHRVYCKEGLENSNPQVGEIHKLCTDKGVEFQSLDRRVFKRLFDKGTVHQGVFCYAGFLPVDVFDIGQLDEAQNGASRPSSTLSAQNSCINESDVNGVDSSDPEHTLPIRRSNPEPNIAEESSLTSTGEPRNSEIAPDSKKPRPKRLWVVLDRVVDPMNVGAILRSCCYFGVSRVLVTPSSAELSPVVSKASSGAAELLRLSLLPWPSEQLAQLRSCGWQVVVAAPQGVDAAPQAVDAAPQAVDAAPQEVDAAPHVDAPVTGAQDPAGGSPRAAKQNSDELLASSAKPQGVRGPPAAGELPPRAGHGQLRIPVAEFVLERDTVLVVGNEGAGISSCVAAVADTVVTVSAGCRDGWLENGAALPCLNVSAATAIILHSITCAAGRS